METIPVIKLERPSRITQSLLIAAVLSQTTQLYALASSLSRKFLCTYNMKGTVHRGQINGIIQKVSNNK